MTQLDTTPPASFTPQPEAYPYVLDDEQTAPPVPHLYRPVHGGNPSERITTATYELALGLPVQVVSKSESGIGSRLSLTISPVGANVAIANSLEALLSITTPGAPLTPYVKSGFVIPTGTTALSLSTCDEIWAVAITTGALVVAWISVLQEQFYGE